MVDINPTILIIILNVNGLNVKIKRQILSEWIRKQDSTICCLEETHFKYINTYTLKVNGWREIDYAKTNQKKARVAILISDTAFFKVRKVIRNN